MELDSFKEILDEQGIGYRESGKSLAVEYCPECERTKYKVFFRVVDVDDDEPFMGRCLSGSCQQNYSSFSYLKKIGVPAHVNIKAHGNDYFESLKQLNPSYIHNIDIKLKGKEERQIRVNTDISHFFPVEVLPKNSTAKWAIARGYTSEQKDIIRIDKKGAVVFIVRDEKGNVKGYQKRFKTVIGDANKTETSYGFLTTENILRFKNDGPIVICEGPFTALSAWHYGFDGVSTFGSGINVKQLELIESIRGNKHILIAQENDDAGYVYYKKIKSYFSWKNISPKIIIPNIGKDLNDAWQNGSGYVIKDGSNYNPALPEFVI